MAEVELRIYVIGYENFEEDSETLKDSGLNAYDMSAEDFIATAEELGTVYSFSRFLGLDCIAFDMDFVRAYYIDVNDENAKPIPANHFNTKLTINKVTCDKVVGDTIKETVLYEE